MLIMLIVSFFYKLWHLGIVAFNFI